MWVGEYPEWERHAVLRFRSSGGRVDEDISRGVPEEHRDLTEKLWREFHSAARQLPFSGSDTESSDSGEALPSPLSPLLALPAGTPFSRFMPRTRSSINTLDSCLSPSNPIARLPVMVAAVRPLPSLTRCPDVHFHTHTRSHSHDLIFHALALLHAHVCPLMIPLARSSSLSTILPPR
jgi:hypothetical protein